MTWFIQIATGLLTYAGCSCGHEQFKLVETLSIGKCQNVAYQ
jgi:hypothetical protein